MNSPVKNMAYWKAKNNPTPAKQTSGGGNPKFGQKFFSGTKPTIEESEERTDKSGEKWKGNNEKLPSWGRMIKDHIGLV